ncbi:TlyA family RNA methyltransferase [Mesoplasma lactucae]|uniref:TlyA family rRNA (Cytidine-2'-O)-methyltransferase n=1 Tax=Mesoplasma lactucae ATCC 49193 TaxID=81460 RepID=A0A291IRH8_9MOLU|nr:TlyA family RNA methyltransferase [Mesoplasma lactucae]ATG97389.1 TlyA family rRNA (cytidine-2'-O)-methyltransferase [Mesoplasma lactucae ATCC 49193]ATZ20158.1 23S rRNA (cytidine1920-2'-O)/16S rRNA (cytidine1409-2'-O)-methyltransferase [Mesoplasma lactucae ATCC 49193]MCL8216907.1 Hemolysin A [Mesoplasma lactucae ATCC 49193]
MDKKRLDVYLFESGIIDSRSRAKSFIEGERDVFVNNKKIVKPSFLVSSDDDIKVIQKNEVEFVSRAGYKLEKAIKYWNLDLTGLTCLDIGASTGGFTQCCLLNNAKEVFSVDVGHDQLVESLSNDKRVHQLDNVNFRDITTKIISDEINFYCCDVSFISLEHILKPLTNLNLAKNSFGVFLIKPQFELSQKEITNGKVKAKEDHFKAIKKVINLATDNNFIVNDLTYSPIKGNKKGNIEYLLLLSRDEKLKAYRKLTNEVIHHEINEAWKEL